MVEFQNLFLELFPRKIKSSMIPANTLICGITGIGSTAEQDVSVRETVGDGMTEAFLLAMFPGIVTDPPTQPSSPRLVEDPQRPVCKCVKTILPSLSSLCLPSLPHTHARLSFHLPVLKEKERKAGWAKRNAAQQDGR